MNVLVTGAAGFIGTHLVKVLFAEGHRVQMLDIEPMPISGDLGPTGLIKITWPPLDIRDDATMAMHTNITIEHGLGIDACVHLAAIAAPDRCKNDPSIAWETNVRGTHNILRLCERAKIPRVVFFSSAHVYGISPLYLPTDERAPLQLHDPYTSTKILAESLLDLFWHNHKISYCTLRLYNAYGSGQSGQYFIGRKLQQAREGGPVTIRNGSVTKDWVHVSDVVRATDFVGPVNVGTGVETRLDAIASQIALSYKVNMVEEPSDGTGPSRMAADWSRARRVLGWEPKVTLEAGLQELIEANK